MRKVKVMATLGPSSKEVLEEFVKNVDVIRINFSHGSREEHGKEIEEIRGIDDTKPVVLDTAGPEIRVKKEVEFEANEPFKLEFEPEIKLLPGDTLLIDDGLYKVKYDGEYFLSEVPGKIRERAKIVVKGRDIELPTITEKDKQDIIFGVKKGFDIIALSFVRRASDLIELRELLADAGAEDVWVISKIEHWKALESLEDIVKLSDGVMVARGDLAVEVAYEKVPFIQKKILELCRKYSKFSIVATQMLASMVNNPTPTRAEISDMINAVLEGADMLMLSNETAVGKYPLRAIEVMKSAIKEAEEHVKIREAPENFREDLAYSAVLMAEKLNIPILCSTGLGEEVKLVSKFRPKVPVYYLSKNERIRRNLRCYFGTIPGKPENTAIVEVEKLLGEVAVKVRYEGVVISRGISFGSGKARGTVGKDIVKVKDEKMEVETKDIIFYGRADSPFVARHLLKGSRIIIPEKEVPEGINVEIDYDLGIIAAI